MIWIIPAVAAMFSFFFIDVLRIPERFKILYRKPFNCNFCLSFWTALLLWLVPESIVNILFSGFAASILAIWGTKKQ